MLEIRYDDKDHRYWLMDRQDDAFRSWTEVPSASHVLGEMSSAQALPWWGMRVGMAAVVAMMQQVSWAEIANAHEPHEIISPREMEAARAVFSKADYRHEKPKSLVEKWAVENKVSTNHVLDEASERGTNVHTVLEALALDEMPDPGSFPAEQRGWVAGLMQWYLDQEPVFLLNEVIVGSKRHRFAGRFDTIVQYPDGRVVLTDLKTSKGVYKKHLRQLALYALAFAEMGAWDLLTAAVHDSGAEDHAPIEAFDGLEVLHVTRTGEYRLVPSHYRPEDVAPTVAAYHADRAGWLRHRNVRGLFEEVR